LLVFLLVSPEYEHENGFIFKRLWY